MAIAPPRPRRLRLAFMGTPDFSVAILDALVDAGHEIAAIYTRAPKPANRGHKIEISPVMRWADTHLASTQELHCPTTLRPAEAIAHFAALNLDAAVVAAYGLILPPGILAAPRLGCLNVHASLLPRWRGAAPIQRAILAGDTETGVTIMQMDSGLDTGGMLIKGVVPITHTTTAAGLHDALADLGARLILPALEGVADGTLTPVAQPTDGVSYAEKLTRDEGAIDWRQSAGFIDRQVRALNPAPGVWFLIGPDRIKLLAATLEPYDGDAPPGTLIDGDFAIACGGGLIRPTRLQRAGGKPVDRRAFLNGTPLPRGTRLLCPGTN